MPRSKPDAAGDADQCAGKSEEGNRFHSTHGMSVRRSTRSGFRIRSREATALHPFAGHVRAKACLGRHRVPKVGLEPTRGFPHRILSRIKAVSRRAVPCRFAPNHAEKAGRSRRVLRSIAPYRTVRDHPVTNAPPNTRNAPPTSFPVQREGPRRRDLMAACTGQS